MLVYYDILPKLWAVTGIWLARYLPERFSGEISHTLIFFFTFNAITTLLNLPISYYSNFVIEEAFGFNKQTLKIWVTDLIKSQALMIALGAPILSAVLSIVQKTGTSFFYYLWLFTAGVQIFAITIYPIIILPMFNKLSPLEPGALKTGVEELAKRLKFPLNELYVIDGSKRSAHSNAYFYGLPWKKHIVIYDTLIEKSETEEVVAVLSHELGHWSLGHTTKLFGIAQVHSPASAFWHRLICSSFTCSTSSPFFRYSSKTAPSTRHSGSTRNFPSSSALSSSLMRWHLLIPSSSFL